MPWVVATLVAEESDGRMPLSKASLALHCEGMVVGNPVSVREWEEAGIMKRYVLKILSLA